MEITTEQLEKWDKGSYRLLDMRSELDISYGSIPGLYLFDISEQ